MRSLLLAAFGSAAWTGVIQAQPVPPVPTTEPERIQAITARMRDNLERLPNYTCTETVRRTRSDSSGGNVIEDVLRLEVALIDDQEIFALPESSEFQDADLRKLITGGTYGSGAFGLYAKLLFIRDDRPEMKPRGLKKLDGSKDGEEFLKYEFSVDRDQKMFTMSDGKVITNVGFKGAIYAYPNTLDLRRIELELTQLPKEFRIKSATDEVDYGRVQIGDERFLLPVANVLNTAGPGGKSRNQVQFAKCRKFQGESVISFLDPAELEAQEAKQVREVMLPTNTDLEIVLESELAVDDLEINAVGGLITGKINRAVRVNGEELIPKGATATGRIVRLERYAKFYALEMRFTDVNWNGGHASVRTRLFNVPFPDRLSAPALEPLQLPPGPNGELVIRLAKPAPAELRGLVTRWKTY